MKRNLLLVAFASLFMVGTTFGQSKTDADKKEKSSQKQEQMNSMEKSDKAGKSASSSTGASKSTSGGSAEEKAREATSKMVSELGLNSQQEQQAMQTNMKYFKGLDEMKSQANENTDKSQMESRKNQMNQQRMSEFKSFLTPEQYSKLESHMQSGNGDAHSSNANKSDKKAKAEGMTPEEKERAKQEKQNRKGGGE